MLYEVITRCGISSVMIPNVWDFDAEPTEADAYNASLRSELGMGDEEVLFLQPTRIVARKGIESAIELVARYNDMVGPSQKGRLLISHPVLDEGNEYQHRVLDYAKYMDVELIVRPVITSYSIHYTKLYDHDQPVSDGPAGALIVGEFRSFLRKQRRNNFV